jgi:hypothetical protein
MPALVAGIHVFLAYVMPGTWPRHPRLSSLQVMKDVDGRDKPGHDEKTMKFAPTRQSGGARSTIRTIC